MGIACRADDFVARERAWHSPTSRRLGRMPAVRYSGSIMIDSPLDLIGFTKQLCDIESITYREGAIGDFLADFLARRGWAVEKTAVEQPPDNTAGGPRWNVYAGMDKQTPE